MAVYYFDSGAVVKRYVNEPGSAWIRRLCDARDAASDELLNLIVLGEVAVVEVSAALSVLVRRNVLPSHVAERAYLKFISEFQSAYKLIPVTSGTLLFAAHLAQHHPLKPYDAVQLSLALQAGALLKLDGMSLILVSGDDRLLKAAQDEGLAAENPFEHVS